MYTYVCVCVCACVCTHTYVCVYIKVCVYMHVHTHTHTHAHTHTFRSWSTVRASAILQTTLCNILQHIASHRNTTQHIATHCNTPQLSATHCNTLQHTARACAIRHATSTHKNVYKYWYNSNATHAKIYLAYLLNVIALCVLRVPCTCTRVLRW